MIWSNVCRFLLAVVFLFSGFVKANDPLGTVYKVQDYLEAWGLQSLSAGYVPYLAAMLCALFGFILGIYLFIRYSSEGSSFAGFVDDGVL